MTVEERRALKDMSDTISSLRDLVRTQAESNRQLIEAISKKVDAKHLPITLESDIMQVLTTAFHKVILDSLGGYNSPLTKLVADVVLENAPAIKDILRQGFADGLGSAEFKSSVRQSFVHKLARELLSKDQALFDKVSQELKQDAVFRARAALAFNQVVEDYLAERNGA